MLQLSAYVEKELKKFDGDSNKCKQGEEQAGIQDIAGSQVCRAYTYCCPFFLISVLGVAANLWSQAAVAAAHSTQLPLGKYLLIRQKLYFINPMSKPALHIQMKHSSIIFMLTLLT